jgi:inner membrane protease subunit 1
MTVLATAGLAWWRWRPFRVEIEGGSMEPTLESGDWALAVRAHRSRSGDVVVVEHPGRPGFELVKRVVAGPDDRAPDGRELGEEEVWVEGDALAASTDSRSFGPVGSDAVVGRVVLVLWPPARWRRV